MKPLSSSARTVLERATEEFAKHLPGGPGEQYLADRGFDLAFAERYRLGLVPANYGNFERMRGMVAIPNMCASGHVVGIKFRLIETSATRPKYDQPDGQESRLFNLQALNHPTDVIALTEGEIDTLSLAALGFPSIAAPGVNNWKRYYSKILEGYRRIILVRDRDDAGKVLVDKVMDTDLDVMVVNPPTGYGDVNEAFAAGQGEAIAAILRAAAGLGEESHAEDVVH